MSTESNHTNLNPLLKSVWQRQQTLHLSKGALMFFRWAIPLFFIGMALDWLIRLPAPLRMIMVIAILGHSFRKAWQGGWNQLRSFNAVHTALRIEDEVGNMKSLLVSAIQFGGAGAGVSSPMLEKTHQEAEKAGAGLKAGSIIRYKALQAPLKTALVPIAALVLFAIVNADFLGVGFGRIFPPWHSDAYPTRTQLAFAGKDMIIQEGEAATIEATVDGVIPREAKLELRTGTGRPRIHKLPILEGHCEYSVKSAFRSFEYRMKAGDARSEWRSVQVIPSPRIATAALSLDYPDYTRKATETLDAMTVTVPEETRINWSLKLDRAVSKAECELTNGKKIPLQIGEDGLTVSMEQNATVSQAYNFIWTEKEHGFTFMSPSHYLQVAPDQAPRAELTSPSENLYATLGRKLELKYRGRDDHGIGEAYVTYRVDKVEETRVPFTVPETLDGTEQSIDWDYRTVLTNLTIGNNVSFSVELVDRYPGPEGAHRARSQSRRISFLSKEDYLAQIARQKKRLLLQLRTIYREERMVHATIRDLEPTSDVFAQSCQLEAVRQDLLRERLTGLKQRMDVLLSDLAANNITNKEETATFVALSGDLQEIADNHIGRSAKVLRELAESATDATAGALPDSSIAVKAIDHAARELAIQILQIGYKEATEVIARELHAIAESEAVIRLGTMLATQAPEFATLATEQDELGAWLTRLLNALPIGKESNVKEALVAFRLTRLSKELRFAGVNSRITEITDMIRKAENVKAPVLQAEVIAKVLKAEFKLRYGAEHDALMKAEELFALQAGAHKQLSDEGASLSPADFEKKKEDFITAQSLLQNKLQMLLLPEIPAGRMSLFDEALPETPAVDQHLAAAESAMKASAQMITEGNKDLAVKQQKQAEQEFITLGNIVRTRIAELTERTQLGTLSGYRSNYSAELALFVERQLGILEKTEDAADDSINAVYIAPLQERLAADLQKFRTKVTTSASGKEEFASLLELVENSEKAMMNALPALKENKPGDSVESQETALSDIEEAIALTGTQNSSLAFFVSALNSDFVSQLPIPYVADIRDEQKDLLTAIAKAGKEDLPRLAVVQKNLVHAVNAILDTLEKMMHHIESGTTMLFAKDDMEAAAVAIEDNDLLEAEDAGSFVAEKMHELYIDLKELAPQYRYVLEVTELLNEVVDDSVQIKLKQRQLRVALESAENDAAKAAVTEQQTVLQTQAKTLADLYNRASGQPALHRMASAAGESLAPLKSGAQDDAIDRMYDVEDRVAENNEALLILLENFSVVLEAPGEGSPTPPEVKLLWDVLELASQQMGLRRRTMASPATSAKDFASEQLELAEKLSGYVSKAKTFTYTPPEETPVPMLLVEQNQSDEKLEDAHKQLLAAKDKLNAGAYKEALASQQAGDDALRHFIFDYVIKYVVPPGAAPSEDPVIADASDPADLDEMMLFMPGQISGSKPKGGRLEWQVLGRRDRAALNENFARELPLEYRAILKTYYERLAQ